jgi:hypothetical protein
MSNIVTFHRVFPAATPPLRADKSALGTLPTAAFQYCEAVRTASTYGWYIFPPMDIRLMWDGVDVYCLIEGKWEQLSGIHVPEFMEYWDSNAPTDLKGYAPPFVISLFVPGMIQIWSGLLVSTLKDWCVLVGPISNLPQSKNFATFEGIIETDTFKPCPLFINMRLLTTDREILIPRSKPLFQVRPLRRECYSDDALKHLEYEGLSRREAGRGSMSDDDWNGFRSTVRTVDSLTRVPGSYGAERRRRARRENE